MCANVQYLHELAMPEREGRPLKAWTFVMLGFCGTACNLESALADRKVVPCEVDVHFNLCTWKTANCTA